MQGNKYKKYCPNVFVIESEEYFNRGDIVEVETRHGKINEVIIFNKLFERDGKKYYSQIRADGFNMQEKAKHTFLKKNPGKRSHSYSLTYAKKDVNIAMKNYDTAVNLWGLK